MLPRPKEVTMKKQKRLYASYASIAAATLIAGALLAAWAPVML